MAKKKKDVEEVEENENEEISEEVPVDPEDLSTFDLDPAVPVPLDVRDIPLEDIAELPNIRPSYRDIEELAKTIYVEGQLQPCLVRPTPNGASHDKPFELIYGYRRKRAIEYLRDKQKLEDIQTLRCEVREVTNREDLSKMIVENMQREQLSPVAEAQAMLVLKNSVQPPLSNAEVARRLGCDPSQVSHRIKMVTKLAIPPAPAEEALPVSQDEETEAEDGAETSEESTFTIADLPAPGGSMEKVKEDEPEEEAKKPEKKSVDILELVDSGKISASGAEVIASLEDRDDQEKLAQLMVRNDWGVKKASKWVQQVKTHTLDEGSEEMGPVEQVEPLDVTELPFLYLREDISDDDFAKANLYILLRNGMDQELLFYLEEKMQVDYRSLWDYVDGLSVADVKKLTRLYIQRYLMASHRFHSLEATLQERLGDDSAGMASEPGLEEFMLNDEYFDQEEEPSE